MESDRRAVLATALAIPLMGAAGCTSFFTNRSIELTVINSSPESHSISIELVREGDVIVKQTGEIEGEKPNKAPMWETTINIGSITKGTELEAKVTIDEGKLHNYQFVTDCPNNSSGDDLIVRVQDGGVPSIDKSCLR